MASLLLNDGVFFHVMSLLAHGSFKQTSSFFLNLSLLYEWICKQLKKNGALGSNHFVFGEETPIFCYKEWQDWNCLSGEFRKNLSMTNFSKAFYSLSCSQLFSKLANRFSWLIRIFSFAGLAGPCCCQQVFSWSSLIESVFRSGRKAKLSTRIAPTWNSGSENFITLCDVWEIAYFSVHQSSILQMEMMMPKD